jgi:hypothetical protein
VTMAGLTLSELLTRSVTLQWYEGIAIVRGVAERLADRGGDSALIPELHQIELMADGSVALAGGASCDEPVRRLGQLLQVLLTDAEPPVQLRLIVSQATAPLRSYQSLRDFDRAVAYFERPDRTALLMVLFARAQTAGPAAARDIQLTLDRMAPLPDVKPAQALSDRQVKNRRRRIGVIAAATLVLAMSGAAVRYSRMAGATVRGRQVSRATAAAADALGATVLAGASALSNSLGLGRIVARDAAAPPAAPAAARMPEHRSKPARAAVDGKPGGRDGANVVPLEIVVYEAPGSRERPSEPPPGQAEALERSPAPSIEDVVYSSGAEGISPPVAVHSKLPRELSPTVNRASLSRIELVVARDGTVESARLVGNRRDVQGGMLLSAVKAWEFRPATKDGAAVRYRKTILVSFE